MVAIGGYLEGQRSPGELVSLQGQLLQGTRMVHLHSQAEGKAEQKASLADWGAPGRTQIRENPILGMVFTDGE